jgi:putative addiction module killer protein
MEVPPKKIFEYITEDGKNLFKDWLASLGDRRARAIVITRIDKVVLGNLGKTRPVNKGVHELKVDYGSGYRVYFANNGVDIILLLCGGTKCTQDEDIKLAQYCWAACKREIGGSHAYR